MCTVTHSLSVHSHPWSHYAQSPMVSVFTVTRGLGVHNHLSCVIPVSRQLAPNLRWLH